MSTTDFRKLVDIHGGDFIGIEIADGATIEVGLNGDEVVKFSRELVRDNLIPRIRLRMEELMGGNEKMSLRLTATGAEVRLTYFDAGMLLDSLADALRFLE